MYKPNILAMILLLVSLAGAAVLAQEVAPEPQEAELEETADTADNNATAKQKSEQEPSDPFDYEASEQISEDRSVSFPVDI